MYLNINANDNINFDFFISPFGDVKIDNNTYVSNSECLENGRLSFGSSYATYYFLNNTYFFTQCRTFFSFSVVNNNLNFLSVYQPFIDHSLKYISQKSSISLACYGNLPIIGYCGNDIFFEVSLFGLKDTLLFLLKGGSRSIEDNSKIDYFNHGDLFFCGFNGKDSFRKSCLFFNLDSSFNVSRDVTKALLINNLYFDSEFIDCNNTLDYFDNFLFRIVKYDNDYYLKKIFEVLSDLKNIISIKDFVNEIIVDENSNLNISKPNYHFEDSENQGFWGR